MKIFTLTLLLLYLFISNIYAESLAEKRQRANNQRSSSETTQTNISYKEQSGYNTQIHILDSERQFTRVKFVPRMFNTWVELLIDAHTLNFISQLKTNGHVNSDGTLKETVSNLSVPVQANQVIQRKYISLYYKAKYSPTWIFKMLQDIGVLDNQGFLKETENFSDTYNANDFQKYLPLLREINLNFSNSDIEEELHRELLRFLKESSVSIHVIQKQTTHYQSRKEGFADSIVDQIGGSLLGSLFFKDKIRTTKHKLTYIPNINTYSMFSNIYFGFVPGPYYKGSESELTYYGLKKQKTIGLQYGKDTNAIKHLGIKFNLNQLLGKNLWREADSSKGFMLSYHDLRDNTAYYTWQNIRFARSNWQLKGLSSIYSFGLSGYQSDQSSGTKLGFGFGAEGTYHIQSGFGAYYYFDVSFGLDFGDDSGIPWLIMMNGIGIQTAISPIRLRAGYEWILEENQVVLYDAFTISLSYYF